ncbi:MAG TPA: hypothetical protein VM791_18510, partial [Vicinamibacterales bacterium]|nr:hypothetical protein [Vicinamibacterales bacterium]
RLHTTVMIVTHDISEAFALAGRIGVVDGGELLIYEAPPLVASSADPRVRAFIDAVPPRP